MPVHCTQRPVSKDSCMTCQVCKVPAWGAAGSRSGRWGTAWSLGRAEGQETPCTFQSLSELCWQLDGAEMPGGREGTSVHQLCTSWATETVQSWGSLCLFPHVASLTRAERAQPSETIVMYVQLLKLELVFILNQSLGKGSKALGNQVEGRNSFVLLNTVYSWLVWKDDGPWSGSYSTFSAV